MTTALESFAQASRLEQNKPACAWEDGMFCFVEDLAACRGNSDPFQAQAHHAVDPAAASFPKRFRLIKCRCCSADVQLHVDMDFVGRQAVAGINREDLSDNFASSVAARNRRHAGKICQQAGPCIYTHTYRNEDCRSPVAKPVMALLKARTMQRPRSIVFTWLTDCRLRW